VFFFCKRAFLDVVLLRANSNRLIKRFTGVLRVEERMILLTSNITSYSSIPSGSKLSSREQSMSFRVVIGGKVVGGVKIGI
jgi:hypothetical protein